MEEYSQQEYVQSYLGKEKITAIYNKYIILILKYI